MNLCPSLGFFFLYVDQQHDVLHIDSQSRILTSTETPTTKQASDSGFPKYMHDKPMVFLYLYPSR
jgi:hypothetical protein